MFGIHTSFATCTNNMKYLYRLVQFKVHQIKHFPLTLRCDKNMFFHKYLIKLIFLVLVLPTLPAQIL